MNKHHPIQPTYKDENGTLRFKPNAIVEYLLGEGEDSRMNEISCKPFSKEDRQQFAQLIGYSVSGFGGLSYVLGSGLEEAAREMRKRGKTEDQARIEVLEAQLAEIKKGLRIAAVAAFNVCGEDLD